MNFYWYSLLHHTTVLLKINIILFSTRKSRASSLYDTESQEPDDVLYDPGMGDLNLEDNATAAYRSAMTSIGRSTQRSIQVVKVRLHKKSQTQLGLILFPLIQMLSDTSASDALKEHCGRRLNWLSLAISPLATMVSSLINNYTFICLDLPCMLKVGKA